MKLSLKHLLWNILPVTSLLLVQLTALPVSAEPHSTSESYPLPSIPAAPGDNCFPVGGKIRVSPVVHVHDEDLLQETGPEVIFPLGFGQKRFPGLQRRRGAILATVTEAQSPLDFTINHFMAFGADTLLSVEDPVSFIPTDDPCTLDIEAQLNFVSGQGIFEGVTGIGAASGTVDACNGNVGVARFAAQLCLE